MLMKRSYITSKHQLYPLWYLSLSVLTIVFLFSRKPSAGRDAVWKNKDRDDGECDRSTTFNQEKNAPRFKLDVDERDGICDDAVDETTSKSLAQ